MSELFDVPMKVESGVMTTAQVAQQLGTKPNVITENAKKCLPNKRIENGKPTYWTQAEVTVLLEALKANNANQHNLSRSLIGYSTDLTPALKIKKAMELMQEGYEEELAILRAKNEAQSEKIAADAPKVACYERIADSTGLKSMQEVAKILGLGDKTLYKILRERGIFYMTNRQNLPYQKQIELGRFEVKEENYTHNGKLRTYSRIYATPKGLLWLEREIKAEGVE